MLSLRRAWERLSLYLPVMLMGVLALGTYWLVRNTPLLLPPEQVLPARHEADYFMRRFSVKTFDGAGRLKSEVLGRDARHYPDTDTLEIELVRIRSFSPEGRLSTASAQQAWTNADASEVKLFGNAQVVREPMVNPNGRLQPRMEFRGEYLHAFMDAERVTSDMPVVLTRGKDQFSADALDFDNRSRVVQLTGRVRGTLVPGTSKQQ